MRSFHQQLALSLWEEHISHAKGIPSQRDAFGMGRDRAADSLLPKGQAALRHQCYVFPTKRAGVFFKQALLQQFRGFHFFLPAILTIEEFIEKLTRQSVTDELTLLFELFRLYQQRDLSLWEKGLDFDRFYAWGRVILKDYDEIDRYLADASKIYSGLQELKEIEHVFGFNEDLREIIANFRSITDKQEKTRLLTEFLKIWQAVGKVYVRFQEVLLEKHYAYAGMLYRRLAEGIGETSFEHPFRFYHFCGFNALSRAEEEIFDRLYQRKMAQMYWDVDALYMDDPREEAGHFLRQYRKKWPDAVWLTMDSRLGRKAVTISAVAQSVGQAHVAAQILGQAADTATGGTGQCRKPEQTAIVLADEKLLLPVLYALPLEEHRVNVSMGYPVKFTVAYDLVDSFLDLYRKARAQGENLLVNLADLKPVLSNAYLSALQPQVYEKVMGWSNDNKKNRLSLKELAGQLEKPELKALFAAATHPKGTGWQSLFEKLTDYLTQVFHHFQGKDESQRDRHKTDLEFIYFFLREFNKISSYLHEKGEELSLKLVKKLVREHFSVARIPFEGEPVEGFQIMGFLETRTLDFKNVIVLSANEGKVPQQRSMNSYIPYALRKVFGLPTFEEQDAIYAYHFKRLLQRAENVHFIYDAEVGRDSSGEQSRFILQQLLKYKGFPNIQVKTRQFTGKLNPPVPLGVAASGQQMAIPKTAAVLAAMNCYLADGGKFLSPTSLTTYITCPLRFYFQYVLGIKEQEEAVEEIDARNFGVVVHEVLELLYQPWLGKEISQSQIATLEKLVEKKVAEVLEKNEIVQEFQELAGKDLLTRQIMQRLVAKILKLDQEQAPFTLKGLERKGLDYQIALADGQKVKLGGTVDRIDEKAGITRILDYKTGRVKLAPAASLKKPVAEYMTQYFKDLDLKSGFQGYFYGLLMRKELSGEFRVGILGMRELNKGTQWLQENRSITPDYLQAFEEQLKGMVQEIYDPTIPFKQTEDLKHCDHCPYNRICGQ